MYKLTPLQKETMEFLKAQIDEADRIPSILKIWEKKIMQIRKKFWRHKRALFIRRVEM